MREILFRAKSVDYGEWKVGGIYQEPKNDKSKEGSCLYNKRILDKPRQWVGC